MKKTDLDFIARQVDRLEFQAPPMPTTQDIFRQIVRIPELWTPEEFAYVQHFHKVYGFDEEQLNGIILDEWSYWHLTALLRYRMTPHERYQALRSQPTTRPVTWRFETDFEREESGRPKWVLCQPRHNYVPYDAPSMQQRGWRLVSVHLPVGLLFGLEPPRNSFVMMEDTPDIIMLIDGPGELGKLMYYLEEREAIHKKYNVGVREEPLDYHFYEPDAGYSYRWEDGSLIAGSYADRMRQRRAERRAERRQISG